MKGFINEFKQFAMRGNVVDLAVGVIIGVAFGKIVSSLVADIVTPGLGLIIGGVDFSDLKIVMHSAVDSSKEVSINYGIFLQAVFDFVIVAFAIFCAIKGLNRLKTKEAIEDAPPAAKPADIALLEEIRDLLKDKK